MDEYLIWYSGKGCPNDVIIAHSHIQAAKLFIIETKGRYLVHKVEKLQ